MAPKTLPPLAKQNLILTYIQKSLTAHNIKELEKTLPGAAGISSMQVKDYLQALTDEGKLRVEKIGSGNWYWSFLSEEKANRDRVLGALTAEGEKVDAILQGLRGQVEAARAMKGGEDDDDGQRARLASRVLELEEEVAGLRGEVAGYKDNDPGEVERRRGEIGGFRAGVERWTDNICVLEGRLREMVGGDGEQLARIQRDVYGAEYVEGEGLREL